MSDTPNRPPAGRDAAARHRVAAMSTDLSREHAERSRSFLQATAETHRQLVEREAKAQKTHADWATIAGLKSVTTAGYDAAGTHALLAVSAALVALAERLPAPALDPQRLDVGL